MPSLGTAAVEHSGTGLGLHAGKKAVNLGAAAAIWLKGALGHVVVLSDLSLPHSDANSRRRWAHVYTKEPLGSKF